MKNPIYNYLKDALSIDLDVEQRSLAGEVRVTVKLKLRNPETGENVVISEAWERFTIPENE